MKKRILSLTLAFVMMFALFPATSVYGMDDWRNIATPIVNRAQNLARIAAAIIPEQTIAPEVAGASLWAVPYVNSAITIGIVPPALQNNYTQTITRAEFAAITVAVYENLMGEITGRYTFSDTDDINVQKAAYLGIMTGVGDGRFYPMGNPSREQVAVMFSRLATAVGQPLPMQAPTFADNGIISARAQDSAGQMQAAGVMGSVGNNNFEPQGPITREQTIVTALRLYRVIN